MFLLKVVLSMKRKAPANTGAFFCVRMNLKSIEVSENIVAIVERIEV